MATRIIVRAHGFAAAATYPDGSILWSGACRSPAAVAAWMDQIPPNGEISVWPLLPTPKNQQEAAIRLGLKPTQFWEDWPLGTLSEITSK